MTTVQVAANTTTNAADRPRRPNPLNDAFDRKRADIDDRIAKLQKRFDTLKNGDSDSTALSAAKGERGRVIGELKESREQMRTLRTDAQNDMKALKDIQALIKKQREDVKEQKEKLPFKSVNEIDARIAQLEDKIEVGSMSLSDEKQVLQDISKLKKTKKTLESLESGTSGNSTDLATLKMKEEIYREKVNQKFALVDEEKKKVEQLEQELERLDGGKEVAQQRQKARQAELDKLKKDIDAAYEERRKLIEEHKDAKQKQREQWERNQARREEEAKRQVIEDEIWELEQKLSHLNPASSIDKKIDECVNVGNYFKSLLPKDTVSTVCTSTITPVQDGEFVAIAPKSSRDAVFIQTGSTASKKKQSCQPTLSLSKLPLHILAALADLSLPVPKKESDLTLLFSGLEVKRQGYEKEREEALSGVKAEEEAIREKIAALQVKLE